MSCPEQLCLEEHYKSLAFSSLNLPRQSSETQVASFARSGLELLVSILHLRLLVFLLSVLSVEEDLEGRMCAAALISAVQPPFLDVKQ